MLLNISKFVDWPAAKMGNASAPFVIGIWGPETLVRDMEKVIRGKTVGSRPVLLRQVNNDAAAGECHVLFVSRGEQKRYMEAAAGLARSAVLTIGESDSFAPEGGLIGLVTKDSRIQMEVNVKAAQRSGVKISSRILRLARVIE